MKKIVIICLAVAMTGCGIYKPYTRPEIQTDGLYGDAESADTMTLGNLRWQEVFTDPALQSLIEEGLANNTDLQSAQWRVKEAEATLKSARLAYLPSFNFAPQGSISSFDNQNTTKTYSIPVTASWQIDIFNGLTNAKRKAKALYAQSQQYEQAVKTQLIANIANLYYTLLMLDSQQEVTRETAMKWEQSVETMRALKAAGMTNEAGVAQYEGNYFAVVASLRDIETSIRQTENSLCSILGIAPQQIERGSLDAQQLPEQIVVGVPVQMLSNRPDVRSAEYALMQAYYATSQARSALYPSITLSGTAGWTNSAGAMIVNPGKLLLTAAEISVEEVHALVTSYGGICYPAHIDRDSYSVISALGFFSDTWGFPAAELTRDADEEAYRTRYPALAGLPIVRSSDAHYLEHIGCAGDEMTLKCLKWECIVEVLTKK